MLGSESECQMAANTYLSDFEILLDHSRDIILFMHYDTGRIIRTSNAAISAYGYTSKELLSLTIHDLRPESDHFAITSQMKNAFDHGIRFETFHRRKDGSMFAVEVSSRGATVGGNRLLVSIVRDMTERRKLEEALRHSEEKFSKAFHHSLVPITITDAQTARYLSVNRAYCEHTGFSQEELIGKRFGELGTVDAETRAEMARRLNAEGRLSNFECRFRAKSGDLRIWVVSATVMYLQGSPTIITSGFDITDRKQMESALRDSEERFRLFMDNSPTIAWMKDDKGRYIYVSGPAKKHYGVHDRDVLGKTDVDLHGPEAAEQFTRNDRAVLAAGRPLDGIEEVIEADGKTRYWMNSKFPFENSFGERFVAGIGMEVTERKQAESNQALQTSILQVLNRGGELHQMIAETLKLVQAAGFDAVGLRLRQGEEWPYFESRGFSQEFLCMENNLCRREKDGQVVHDVEGRPLLECTCGLVLADKADPSLPFFTSGGSFWTNAASATVAFTRVSKASGCFRCDREIRSSVCCSSTTSAAGASPPKRSSFMKI
jgi:PAS domain S-box-containing protein